MHVAHKGCIMELEQLRQLDAIERFGTMSAAANELHLTQPSLSRSMKRLEADLGQELFTRTGNRAVLNDAGRIALQHARTILADERRMRDAFDELARRQRTLKVASVAPAPTWRMTALVVERFPGVILDPDLLPVREVEGALLNQEADFSITRRPLQLPGMASAPLMTEDLYLSVPETSPYADRTSVSFADVDGEAFLVFEQIGFWMDIARQNLPNSQIIVQKDRMVFAQLITSTDLLCFTTDAPENTSTTQGRVRVPIVDGDAHATFFLNARTDSPKQVADIIDWVRSAAS